MFFLHDLGSSHVEGVVVLGSKHICGFKDHIKREVS